MGTGITIKKIATKDTLPLRRDVLYPGQPLAAVKLEQDDAAIHFGVLEDGRLVSVGSLFLDGQEAQFRKLATLPEAQGRGYGSMLIKRMRQHCREAGISLLWCNARQTAEGFYTRLGFKRTGE